MRISSGLGWGVGPKPDGNSADFTLPKSMQATSQMFKPDPEMAAEVYAACIDFCPGLAFHFAS
jgi:hypothetical protein